MLLRFPSRGRTAFPYLGCKRTHHLLHTLSTDTGQSHNRSVNHGFQFSDQTGNSRMIQGVDFIERGNTGFSGQTSTISVEFPDQRQTVLQGFGRRTVDQMQQSGATLNMPEEAVTEPTPLMSALYQSRNVRQNEFKTIHGDQSQIRMKRGEWIFRDFWPGIRCRGQQRRLSGIRQTQQTDVGDQLQSQPNGSLDTLLSHVKATWCLVHGGLEPQISETAIPSFRQEKSLSDPSQIDQHGSPVLFKNLGSGRYPQEDVGAILSGTLPAHPTLAVLCEEMLPVSKVNQRVKSVNGFHPDIATLTPVAAIRPPVFNELLAPE